MHTRRVACMTATPRLRNAWQEAYDIQHVLGARFHHVRRCWLPIASLSLKGVFNTQLVNSWGSGPSAAEACIMQFCARQSSLCSYRCLPSFRLLQPVFHSYAHLQLPVRSRDRKVCFARRLILQAAVQADLSRPGDSPHHMASAGRYLCSQVLSWLSPS